MIQWAVSSCAVLLAAGSTPCLASTGTPAADFYVAANGCDSWSGRRAEPNRAMTDGPFKTLERARDAVRKQNALRPGKGITVMVRGGCYDLSQTFALGDEDSGTPEAPIIFRAYPREKVVLAGGRTVPPAAFKPVKDPEVLERLAPQSRGHVLEADLSALGFAEVARFPVKFETVPSVPELFFNDRRMTLARWPDEGWATIAGIVTPGSDPSSGDKSNEGGVFEYSGDRPRRWNVEAGVWLRGFWCYDWYNEAIQVKSIDREKRQITLAAPAYYSVKQGNPSPRRYYALNLIEELDRPGEYFIDTNANRLYFWPPAPLAGSRIVLSSLQGPIAAIKDAHDVTLRGFVVEATLGSGIEVSGGCNVLIQACEVRNTRQHGIVVTGGKGHKTEACDVHDTGTGGVSLSGGDRKTLTAAGHEAVNNHIWRFSQHKLTYSNALTIEGVGNRAAHNLIHDAPHQAVSILGNDCVFEYNVVHHVCMETDDCGALYKGRNPSCRGNIIRCNFFHNIGSPMGHGNSAIYFDDGDGGETVFGNVFYRCGEPGNAPFGAVFSHGGHDNKAENNIFIECKRALGSAPWDDSLWKEAVGGGLQFFWKEKLLKEVDITKPPYTTRYPELVGFLDPKPGQTRVNRALRNVFVKCADISSGNWQVPSEQNWATDRDPGFVDADKGDFRLKPGSEVFSKLPGF